MRIHQLITSLLALRAGAAASAEDGNVRRTKMDMGENRIIGGQLAQATGKKFPFFVATGQCGGSLVAPDVVMSVSNYLVRARFFLTAEYSSNSHKRNFRAGCSLL